MWESLQDCFQAVNLPFTILLLLFILYWVLTIAGFVGTDLFDIDFDADAGSDPTNVEGVGVGLLKFLHFGEVPVMVIGTIFAFCMWASMLTANHYFNQNYSWLMAIVLFGPCAALSLIVGKILLLPIAPLFRSLDPKQIENENIIGRSCIVTTSEVNDRFGQAEVESVGAPVVVQVRSKSGRVFLKGQTLRLTQYDQESNTYLADSIDLPIKPKQTGT
jgi:Protein of unknown function (DUF1449)